MYYNPCIRTPLAYRYCMLAIKIWRHSYSNTVATVTNFGNRDVVLLFVFSLLNKSKICFNLKISLKLKLNSSIIFVKWYLIRESKTYLMHVFAWNCSIPEAIAARSSEEKELEMVYGISTYKLPSALGHFWNSRVVPARSSVPSSKVLGGFSCSSAYFISFSLPPSLSKFSAPRLKSSFLIGFPLPSPGSNFE